MEMAGRMCSLMERLERDLMKRICEYMDVTSICRTDTATAVKREARDAWLLAIKGLISPAMSKYHKHCNDDDFAALRWCMKKLIMLRKIRLWRIVDSRFFCPPCAYAVIPEDAQFQWLCVNGKQDIAHLIVTSRSIDVNRVSSDSHYYQQIHKSLEPNTPILHVALEFGLTKLAKFLLYNGANILSLSSGGFTCLHAGIRSRKDQNPRNIETVKLLFEYPEAEALKEKPTDDGITPLLLAVLHNNKKMVAALLEYVDPNKCAPSDGLYPIMFCASDEIRSLLIGAGAHDTNSSDADYTKRVLEASDSIRSHFPTQISPTHHSSKEVEVAT